MKKYIAMLLTIVLTLTVCCVPVSAETEYDLYSYEVLEDGTACITDYNERFNDEITSLVVPAEIDGYTVSTIGDCAFLRAFYLDVVVLPDTVTVIGRSAFQESGIEYLFLPKGLVEIRDTAFFWCNLKHLILPSTVTVIGEHALGFTIVPAEDEEGHPIVPGAIGHDEDFVLYVQDSEAAVCYAQENGVTFKLFADTEAGDMDLDGVVGSSDARTALQCILSGYEGGWSATCDLNGDAAVTTADVRLLLHQLVA